MMMMMPCPGPWTCPSSWRLGESAIWGRGGGLGGGGGGGGVVYDGKSSVFSRAVLANKRKAKIMVAIPTLVLGSRHYYYYYY